MLIQDCMRIRMTSKRVGYFLLFLGFVWGITLINMTISNTAPGDSDLLREEILQLSEKYVRNMAKETQNTIDGPYAGRLTGYDLKKTMAVLLENMMDRLDRLEHRMDDALRNGTLGGMSLVEQTRQLEQLRLQIDQQKALNGMQGQAGSMQQPQPVQPQPPDLAPGMKPIIDMKGLILGEQENCALTDEVSKQYPHCRGKMAWMQAHWKSDACYSTYGVDGSDCSFRVYLSEVEHWCPLLPGRKVFVMNSTVPDKQEKAVLNFDLSGLMAKLADPGQRPNYEWIRQRIQRMWASWTDAAKELASQENLAGHSRKRILVHLGLLSQKAGFKIAENSFKGGPLGELVQWSDIISSLYVLGHDLIITSEVEQLTQILGQFPSAESQCQIRDKVPVDMIFSDIVGLTQFKKKVKNGYGKFSCLLRIIDSFGTEPAFNYEPYAKAHKMKTTWGMQNLNPQQFFTMFPHSPDNSFMGFVIENHLNESDSMPKKKKVPTATLR